MTAFCLLTDPTTYIAQDIDFSGDSTLCQHWLDQFAKHFEQALQHAAMQYGRTSGRLIKNASLQFAEQIANLRENPTCLPGGKLNVMELCRLREKILRANRIGDPFGVAKARENEAAMKLYPRVVRDLHARRGRDRWEHLVRSVFAGNLFDLGSAVAMHLAVESMDFLAQVENTKPRPWLVDDFDRLAADLPDQPPTRWGKVVIFIDNAGSDFILGIMPLARELSLYGTKVVLAANELPSLNDMTVNETITVIEKLATGDSDLQALIDASMLEVVSTGTDLPMIDLANVSDELNAAAADAELVILEGSGRAFETNYDAKLKVDTLKLALLKEETIAEIAGGKVFDCVCRYEPIGG